MMNIVNVLQDLKSAWLRKLSDVPTLAEEFKLVSCAEKPDAQRECLALCFEHVHRPAKAVRVLWVGGEEPGYFVLFVPTPESVPTRFLTIPLPWHRQPAQVYEEVLEQVVQLFRSAHQVEEQTT